MNQPQPLPPSDVVAVLARAPAAPQARLYHMRGLIFAAAAATGTAPLRETLKWGQPAYLPDRRAGTTVRLNWSAKSPEHCEMLVHCQTSLVAQWRQLYPNIFSYDGSRAVLLPTTGAFADAALQQMAAMALTYHRA